MKALIFTYLVTAFGAGAGLFRPFYALCAYVCFAIVKPDGFWAYAVPQAPYSKIIAIPMLIGWIVGGTAIWKLGAARGVVACLTGFVAWGTLSAVLAEDPKLALIFTDAMVKILLPFFVGITTINSTRELRILCWTIVLSQGYLAFEMNLSYLQGFNAMALGATGLENNSAAIAMAAGAGFSVMIGFLAPTRFQKCVVLVCSAMMVHAVMMSDSRGGMLGVAITGIVVLILTPKNPRTLLAFTVIGLLVLRFTGPAVMERFSTAFADKDSRDSSAASRVFLWQDCRDLIKQHPILGVGPNHWRAEYAEVYGWPPGKSAHSTWLEVAAEMGIPGMSFLIAFYGWLSFLCWRWVRTHYNSEDALLYSTCAATIVGLTGFAVSASFVTYWGAEISYYIALSGAAALRIANLSTATVQPLPSVVTSSQTYARPTA